MAKKNVKNEKEKGGFEMIGFALEIPQESFDKLLEAMTESKKRKGVKRRKKKINYHSSSFRLVLTPTSYTDSSLNSNPYLSSNLSSNSNHNYSFLLGE